LRFGAYPVIVQLEFGLCTQKIGLHYFLGLIDHDQWNGAKKNLHGETSFFFLTLVLMQHNNINASFWVKYHV